MFILLLLFITRVRALGCFGEIDFGTSAGWDSFECFHCSAGDRLLVEDQGTFGVHFASVQVRPRQSNQVNANLLFAPDGPNLQSLRPCRRSPRSSPTCLRTAFQAGAPGCSRLI